MAKRHYLPITADVPGVSDGRRAFLRKVIRTALAAEGETVLSETKHIMRGYEDITGTLCSLGADIR